MAVQRKASESFLNALAETRKQFPPYDPKTFNYLKAFDNLPSIKANPKIWGEIQKIGAILKQVRESRAAHKKYNPPDFKFWESVAVNKDTVRRAKAVFEKFQRSPKPKVDLTSWSERYLASMETHYNRFKHNKEVAEQRMAELKEEIKNIKATSELMEVMEVSEVAEMHPEWVERMVDDMKNARWHIIFPDPPEAVEGVWPTVQKKVGPITKIDDILTYQQRAFQIWTTEKMNVLKDIAEKEREIDIYLDEHPTGHGGH